MNRLPNQIQKDLASYIEMFSCLYDVGICVVDNDLSVVMQNGSFTPDQTLTCRPVSESFKTGLPFCVDNPAAHPLCEGCQNLSHCRIRYIMCFPMHEAGVMLLTADDENQRHMILQNQEKIRRFFAYVSSLISRQISANRNSLTKDALIKRQNRLLNMIQEGVILFSSSGQPLYANKKAERVLGNTVPQLLYLKKIGRFTVKKGLPSLAGLDQYIITVKNKTIRLVGTSSPITDLDGFEEDGVFIFSDYEIIPEVSSGMAQKKAAPI